MSDTAHDWVIYINDPEKPVVKLYGTRHQAGLVLLYLDSLNSEGIQYALRQMS